MADVRTVAGQIKARLESDSRLRGRVVEHAIDPEKPTMAPPYLVLYAAMPGAEDRRMSRQSKAGAKEHGASIIATGTTPAQAQYFAQIVDDLMDGWKPVVSGWRFSTFNTMGNLIYGERDTTFIPPVDYYRLTYRSLATRRPQ